MPNSTAISAPPTTETPFGEADPAVLTVYFLAFGFWTAAAGNDFISSTWRSVRETRMKGKAHVVFVSIPMIYICVYIYFQHKNEDYKEMGAALLALAFALLHLARTFMGLWQLHMFKQWAISCIKSMESLGYETALLEKASWEADESDSDADERSSSNETESESDRDSDENASDDNDHDGSIESGNHGNARGNRPWFQMLLLAIFPEEHDRIKKLADDILVNETLIDNRLSDVHTVCKFRLFSSEEKRNMKKAKSASIRLWLWLRYGSANAIRGIRMLFSLTFLKSPSFPNVDSAPRLVPKRPESIWLNWATALVAQTGWMLEEFSHTDPDPSASAEEFKNHFAAQILLSAAFHTQRIGLTTANINAGTLYNDVRAQNSSSMSEFLGFENWHKYPNLCKGEFSKQEFLKRACQNGNGLPYHARHSKAVEVKDYVRQYGYSNFESELTRAREQLPPEIETRVSNFDVEQLEWFTIFVSVENWTPRTSAQETATEGDAFNSADVSRSESHSESPTEFQTNAHERFMPVQNLKAQLGLEKMFDFALEHSKLPFLRHTFDVNLWGNRNVLEASCHIDNWISLSNGEMADEMLQLYPEGEKLWIDARNNASGDDSLDIIIQANKSLASWIIFNNSVSFLGCCTEMLRSLLAKWAESNEGGDESSWKPPLFPTDVVCEEVRSTFLEPFDASADFIACIRSLRSFADMSKLFVKMRVLWELQNHFYTHLRRDGAAPSRGEAMALCILSFPGVSADAVRMGRKEECVLDLKAGNEETVCIDDYGYIIRASLGAQDLQLCVSFKGREENSKVEISVCICEMEACGITHFDWEMWRNAFFGRLEGRRRDMERHSDPRSSLIRPAYPMASGIQKIAGSSNVIIPQSGTGADMSVWKGWLPHCAKICVYELATDGFILQPRPYDDTSLTYPITNRLTLEYSIPHRIWVPVGYAEANAVWLRNACFAADDLLQCSFGSNAKRDAQSTLERAEVLLAEKSDANAGLALELIQVSAVHERDFTALEKAVEILRSNGRTLEAVELLQQFYVRGSHSEGDTQNNSGHFSSFVRNETYVNKFIFWFNEIRKATKLDILVPGVELYKKQYVHDCVVESYQMFLLLSIIYGETNTQAVELLSLSIGESKVGDAATCFAFLLEKGRAGVQRDLSRAIELYEREIEEDKRYAKYNLAVLLSNGDADVEQDLPRAMELLDNVIDHGDVNAMIRLADLLVKGGERFPKNLPRVVELYTRAMHEDEGGSVEAMEKLAGVLRSGGDGVQKDVQQSVSLYTRAIEESGSTSAMDALATILETGDDGFPADPERAAALSRNKAA